MSAASLLPMICLWLAGAASADVYRCPDPDGGIRFVGNASRCAGAQRVSGPSGPGPEDAPRKPERRVRADPAPASKPAGTPSTRSPAPARTLESLLPDALALGEKWTLTRELPVTSPDADLRSWGVRSTAARHYGRTRDGLTEVCSVELWRFTGEARARIAAAGFSYPGWHIERRADVLLLLRGTRWRRGERFRSGLFPACHELARGILPETGAAGR